MLFSTVTPSPSTVVLLSDSFIYVSISPIDSLFGEVVVICEFSVELLDESLFLFEHPVIVTHKENIDMIDTSLLFMSIPPTIIINLA